MSGLRGLLDPPAFPEDANKTRVARTLHTILLISLVGVALYTVLLLGFAQGDGRSLIFAFTALFLVLFLWYLMRKGRVSLASSLLVSLAWINLTASAIADGYGIRGTSLLGYVLIVVTAGLLINGRAAVTFALLNGLSGLALIYLENSGFLPERVVLQTSLTIWTAHTVFSVSAALILRLALNNLREALDRAALNESYYRMLFEEAPDGICIVDMQGMVVMANSALLQMTGYTETDVIGRSAFEFIAPEDAARHPPRGMKEIRESGLTKRERILLRKDGVRLTAVVSSNFMPDGNLQLILQDITDRKSIEEALRLSEEKFSKSFQSSPDAITISLLDSGTLIDVNDGFVRMSGFSREEALGISANDLKIWVDPSDRDRLVAGLLRQGYAREFETRLRRKSGEIITCLLSAELIELSGRQCMVVVTRDVTERKRIEDELRKSEERYRLVTSVISDYTFSNVLNDKGEIVLNWVAGAFEQISGYTLDEFNSRGGWLSTVHPDDRDRDAVDMEILRRNEKVVSELRTIHKDGSVRWVRSYAHPVWDEERHVLVGIYGAVQDITSRKQIELEREALIKELGAKNAELEQFTYTVSHDLKAPLITIKGFLGYLKEDLESGNRTRLHSDLERIAEAANRMHLLLNDLLELSRVGRLMNEPERLSMWDLVTQARENIQSHFNDTRIQIDIDADLPEVLADRQRILEVLQNLLDNAAKFMGSQENPSIHVGHRSVVEGGFATFFVRDNGVGIAPQYHERIFGLFNRLDPHVEGTGVGLALVRRIIEFHGGRIWVESEEGKGSAFCFTLPVPPTGA